MHKTSYGSRGCIVVIVLCSLMPGVNLLGQDAATERAYPIGELKEAAAIREAVWRADPHAKTTFDRAQGRVIVAGSVAAQEAALSVSRGGSDRLDTPRAMDDVNAQPMTDIPQPPVLRVISVPAQHVQPISTAVGLRYRNTPGVQISPDRQQSRLLIMAPPELQDQIATDVDSLLPARGSNSNSTANGSRQPLRIALRSIGWQQFEDTLQDFVGERLPVTTSRNGELATFQLVGHPLQGTTVEVDRRANTVTVVAPQPAIPGWQRMINSLDQSTLPPGAVAELIRVQNAEPAPIQRAIRLLGNFRPDDTAAVAKAPQQDRTGVRFQGAVFQEPQAQPPADGDQDVDEDFEDEPADGGGGLIGDTEIQFVPELGVIIVKGSRRDVDRVMQVIEQIEAQSAVTQPEVEIYPLNHVNSQAIADLIDDLYSEVLSARQGAVSITSLDKPNALLLIGRKEALENVRNLIEQLDQPVAPSTQLRVYRLENASALDAEETIRTFFTDQPGEDEELRPGLGTRARVISDYRTNSLIVQASPRDLTEVTKLVEELDVESTPSKNELKVIKLRNALAEDLAPVLQEAIHGESDVDVENFTQPSRTLSILTLDAEGNRLLDSGLLAGTVITADANSNALIVRASSSSVPLIEELIRQLDQPPGAESLVKVFTVENGDAVQLTTALQNLFGTAGATTGAGGGAGAPNIAGLAPTSAGESSLVSLRFSTDQRTNSIIASGSASDLEVVESLLLRLDTSGFAERVFEVIWLRNQFAPDVAAALQQFVTSRFQQSQQIQQFQQGLGPYDALERDLVVVAEPTSNSLVISVAPRLYDTVRRIIDQLDRRAPMIMVKVLIAEVTLTDGIEVGMEFGVQDSLLFDRGIAGTASNPGFNFNNAGLPNQNTAGSSTLAEQAVTTFGLGRTSQNFGYGGFVLSAASDSVSLLLRTLQDAGRMQILSRPQLMTLDNTEGVVQVGALVPRVTSVTQGALGVGPTIGTEDVEVGLILRVTPRVGRDGLIVMNVDAIRSSVGDISQGIPVGFGPDGEVILSPQIEQTTAQSVITAFSGQTVVYGGLIQKQRSQIIRRVPYVSDIPILGRLFRYDQETETRNELLVVLTPMIVSGGEDLEYIKQTESARMSWCLPEIVEMHGDVGLNGGHGLWGPALPPVIYPDMQPTVDDFDLIHPYEHVPPEAHYEGGSPGYPHQAAPHGFHEGVPQGMYPAEGTPVPLDETVPLEGAATERSLAPPETGVTPPAGPPQESVLQDAETDSNRTARVQPAAYNQMPRQASPVSVGGQRQRVQPPAGSRPQTAVAGEMSLPAEWENRLNGVGNAAPATATRR